jgi:LAO/AO transport system kinase
VVLLTEAAGYHIILVETVGLGQSEVAVDATVDMLTLVVPPAGGDELQGVKKGIMEVADLVVVNKADGAFLTAARRAAGDVRRALLLVRRKHKDWKPAAVCCSALEEEGVDAVWGRMSDFWRVAVASGRLHSKRQSQATEWAHANASSKVQLALERSPAAKAAAAAAAAALGNGHMTPRAAGRAMAEAFLREQRSGSKGGGTWETPTCCMRVQ